MYIPASWQLPLIHATHAVLFYVSTHFHAHILCIITTRPATKWQLSQDWDHNYLILGANVIHSLALSTDGSHSALWDVQLLHCQTDNCFSVLQNPTERWQICAFSAFFSHQRKGWGEGAAKESYHTMSMVMTFKNIGVVVKNLIGGFCQERGYFYWKFERYFGLY